MCGLGALSTHYYNYFTSEETITLIGDGEKEVGGGGGGRPSGSYEYLVPALRPVKTDETARQPPPEQQC